MNNKLFQLNKNNQLTYKIFPWGKEYIIINDDIKNKIIELESYRYLIWTYRPPIFLLLLFIAFIFGVISFFIIDIKENTIKLYMVNFVFLTYALISLIYYRKLKKTILQSQ